MTMKALILAGGSGTRLWPASRNEYPKQFLKLGNEKSLLQKTILRKLHMINSDDIFILTNFQYFHAVKEQISQIDSSLCKNIILEPFQKNTAPAIALALKYMVNKNQTSTEDTVMVLPSDHMIEPVDEYCEFVKKAAHHVKKGNIVAFGIKPKYPEVGYGYIQAGLALDENCFEVSKFHEKPKKDKAQEYFDSGCYFWNSGMLCFKIDTMLQEFKSHCPEIAQALSGSFEETASNFVQMPDISIDYAVMEKSLKVILLPMQISWSDVGSWDNVYDILPKDICGNAKVGHVVDTDSKNCLIMADKRLIATIGLEDTIVIETQDSVLIAKKNESQKVKEMVQKLKELGKKEVKYHVCTSRPWGSYTILEEGQRYKIKKILVNPSQTLSLQMHYHRSEHWVVVKGTAKVTIEGEETFVHENESIFVPKGSKHRVSNPGKVALEIIETQVGEYLGEDDIVRFEDIYGRIN
jgi:mannose-1-phosphate guanylyltransferase/mannose-6-phosphate isomerase